MIGLPTLTPAMRLDAEPEVARAIHDRRALDGAAEHAVALGDALSIPAVDLAAVLANAGDSRISKPLADDHVCTAEEAAVLDWEPWTGECPVPPNSEWPAIGGRHLPFARMAWLVNCKSKEALMECLAGMDEEDATRVERLCDDIRDTTAFFKAFHDLMEVAELRLLVALSTMTVDPRYRQRFGEGNAP